MSTLRAHKNNPTIVVTKARMIFQGYKKHTFVVEGATDVLLYKKWLVDRNASIECVGGKEQVREVWKTATKDGFREIHCLVDVDYDVVIKDSPMQHTQLVYVSVKDGKDSVNVECNDLEAVLIRSDALSKVMTTVLSNLDMREGEGVEQILLLREKLRLAARIVGAFRAADREYYLKRNQSPIGTNFITTSDAFFDPVALAVDINKLMRLLRKSSCAGPNAMDEVIDKAERYLHEFGDGWQLCRGHDLTLLLAGHLSHRLGRRVEASEIERDLRAACDLKMIRKTGFGMKLMKIEELAGKAFLKAPS